MDRYRRVDLRRVLTGISFSSAVLLSQAAMAAPTVYAVFPVVAKVGSTVQVNQRLSDALLQEALKLLGQDRVMGTRAVGEALGTSPHQALSTCGEADMMCLAQLGSMLGVPYLVLGRLRGVMESAASASPDVLTLSIIDVTAATCKGSQSVPGATLNDALQNLPAALAKVLDMPLSAQAQASAAEARDGQGAMQGSMAAAAQQVPGKKRDPIKGLGYAMIGVGAACAIGAVVSGARYLAWNDLFKREPVQVTAEGYMHHAQRAATASYVVWGVAGALLIGGTTLLIVKSRKPKAEPAVSATILPMPSGGLGATLSGRW